MPNADFHKGMFTNEKNKERLRRRMPQVEGPII